MLGMVRGMCNEGKLSVLMITHKFREVMAFCDEVTVLRQGKLMGEGIVTELTPKAMAQMMMGTATLPEPAAAGRERSRRVAGAAPADRRPDGRRRDRRCGACPACR